MSQTAIKLTDITFQWTKQSPGYFSIADFSLEQGNSVFIYGPSGSGKSTFLSILACMANIAKGQVELLGENISSQSTAEQDSFRASHMGIIFQQFNLIPYLSVIENVVLPCKISKTKKNNALKAHSSVEHYASELLNRLLIPQSLFHKKSTAISVGQQQRAAVARALAGSPEIIIADEPTSALDADSREHFIELFKAMTLEHQKTVLFVSHDKGLAQYFDRAFEISDILQFIEADLC